MTVKAVGKKLKVYLNGTLMSELENERSAKGHFGIQLHSNENTQIKLRNIQVKEL